MESRLDNAVAGKGNGSLFGAFGWTSAEALSKNKDLGETLSVTEVVKYEDGIWFATISLPGQNWHLLGYGSHNCGDGGLWWWWWCASLL